MKLRLLLLLTGILFAGATLFAWLLAGPATRFEEPRNYLFIRTGAATQEEVMQTLRDSSFIRNTGLFAFLANRLQVWPRLRPGKYVIEKGTSLLQLARKLRNQQQEPVNLVVVKLRTNRQFAGLVGRRFECDSLRFLTFISNPDSTRNRGVDSTTLLSIVLPDTYTYYWSATPAELLEKLAAYHQKFWNAQRKQRADSLGLSPLQITVLASIVEEETLRDDEKPLIASVYLNRLRRGMPLGADPTVKYATGDFTLRRILFKHIQETAASPYNTYRNKGLPPGPICTPTAVTIDAVLNAARSNYLFFCARPNGNGYHAFAETDTEHLRNARAYQQWLNAQQIR